LKVVPIRTPLGLIWQRSKDMSKNWKDDCQYGSTLANMDLTEGDKNFI
jgi:hypothetical protein